MEPAANTNNHCEVSLNHFRLRSPAAALLRPPPDTEEPIASEMFSIERLELFDATLAREQEV